jgi:hypothetical protein
VGVGLARVVVIGPQKRQGKVGFLGVVVKHVKQPDAPTSRQTMYSTWNQEGMVPYGLTSPEMKWSTENTTVVKSRIRRAAGTLKSYNHWRPSTGIRGTLLDQQSFQCCCQREGSINNKEGSYLSNSRSQEHSAETPGTPAYRKLLLFGTVPLPTGTGSTIVCVNHLARPFLRRLSKLRQAVLGLF